MYSVHIKKRYALVFRGVSGVAYFMATSEELQYNRGCKFAMQTQLPWGFTPPYRENKKYFLAGSFYPGFHRKPGYCHAEVGGGRAGSRAAGRQLLVSAQ